MASKENLNNSLPLSVDMMPECWSKDERMNALFAEFRNRSVNSQDWDSKYKFWDKLISDWLSSKQYCSFSVSDLNAAFKRKGCTPLCLKTVVEELLRNGEVVSETEFLRESSGGWTAWAIETMVKRPARWSFSKLKNYLVKDVVDLDAKYVHLRTMKELANLVLSTVDNNNDNVLLSLSQVRNNCIAKSDNENITEQNIKLALLWLRNTNRAAFRGNILRNGEFLVKLSIGDIKEVSEAEEGLFRLTEQEKLIIKNIEELETERNAVLTRARSSLASGYRELAKTCVRKKRDIERSIEKRAAALHNVQTLIARIRDAHSNTEILSAYKTGSDILKNFENNGLTEENVVNTMDDVSEAVNELAELQSIITTTIGSSDVDLELEEELRELLDASPDRGDTTKIKKPSLPDLTNMPDLQKELSNLNIKDFPLPPQTSLGTSTLYTSPERNSLT